MYFAIVHFCIWHIKKLFCKLRVLRREVYIMKSRGPRTEPWETPYKQEYEGKKKRHLSHGMSEMIGKT